MLIGPHGMTAFAGGLGIPVGTGLLALTALPALRRTRNVEPLLALQIGLASLVVALGEELKLPATTRRHLAVGGLLHDIGKLSVPRRGAPAACRARCARRASDVRR